MKTPATGGQVWWRASMGGFLICWPHNDGLPLAAKALRCKPEEAGLVWLALGGSQQMAVARILLGMAAGRPIREDLVVAGVRVADEADVNLRAATVADIEQWRAHERVQQALKPGRGRRRKPAGEQLGLGL